jgi:hypothetical protein
MELTWLHGGGLMNEISKKMYVYLLYYCKSSLHLIISLSTSSCWENKKKVLYK